MTVELWIDQEFNTFYKQQALRRLMSDMNERLAQIDEPYFVLANYFVNGHQIDLTILKRDAIIIIILKDGDTPFQAPESGTWQADSETHPLEATDPNPFERAKAYRLDWIDLLNTHQHHYLASDTAHELDFNHVSAFVVISPTLHPQTQNKIPTGLPSFWFKLLGLDTLSTAIYQQSSAHLNFSRHELRRLITDVLKLRRSKPSFTKGVPHRVGRYNILALLGRGGAGAVYRAHDPEIDREVVIKFIDLPDLVGDNRWRERFKREVRAGGNLNHPHIITIYDVDLDHEPPYVVMELLLGGTLQAKLQGRALPWREAVSLLRALTDALAYAHQSGVIHRDVKPANIMFSGGKTNVLKLVDFGLAHRQYDEHVTTEGTVIGTPSYMSPEQARGESVDGRTDIFSLGIILYETLAGFNPLAKDDVIATISEIISDVEIDTTPLTGKIPPRLIDIVKRAIVKDRTQRYPTCTTLLADLTSCLIDLTDGVNHEMKLLPPISGVGIGSEPTLTIPANESTTLQTHPKKDEIEAPYGTMHPDSRFYVERQADAYTWQFIEKQQATTLFVQAPRQMGKSSLMRRGLHQADLSEQKHTIFIDFQKFPKHYFNDEENLLIDLCVMIGDALKIPEAIDRYWRGRRTNIRKCSLYISEYIIPQIKRPFVLAMDEVERMLDSPFRADFFGMLRTWHNDRAYDENFARMTLFLSSSTEPYLFIDNPHQSPFNVAEVISLQAFTRSEIDDLNRRHQSPLNAAQIDALINLVGGHPFLIRVALYQIALKKIDFPSLLAQATQDDGPFGNHLRYYDRQILRDPHLRKALTRICRTGSYEKNQLFYRLKGAGLIKQHGQRVLLRNELYTRYFKEHLDD